MDYLHQILLFQSEGLPIDLLATIARHEVYAPADAEVRRVVADADYRHVRLLCQDIGGVGFVGCRVGYLDLIAQGILQALQRRDTVRRRAGVPVANNGIGTRTNHCYLLHLLRTDGKQIAFVLQQDNRFRRYLPHQGVHFRLQPRVERILDTDGSVGILLVGIQQTQANPDAEQAAKDGIDVGFRNQPIGQRLADIRCMDVVEHHIDAALDAGCHRRLEVGEVVMVGNQMSQTAAIGTDNAILPPLLHSYVFQDRMDGARYPVVSIIRRHKCPRAAFGDAFIKGITIVFAEEALVEVRGVEIAIVLVAVRQEVLHQRGCLPILRMVALQTLGVGYNHAGNQEGVFAKAFLRPSPARVAA